MTMTTSTKRSPALAAGAVTTVLAPAACAAAPASEQGPEPGAAPAGLERLTPEQTGGLRAATWAAAPFMDPGTDPHAGARDACEQWPEPPTLGFPYAQDVDGVPLPPVVSITGDPTTPYEGGNALAEALGGTVLTVEGEEHTIVMRGTSPCVDQVASAYLIDLQLPPADARCTV